MKPFLLLALTAGLLSSCSNMNSRYGSRIEAETACKDWINKAVRSESYYPRCMEDEATKRFLGYKTLKNTYPDYQVIKRFLY